MKKQHASIVLVFGGFAVLVLTVRGTFGNAFHALFGAKPAASSTSSSTRSSGGVAGAPAAALLLRPGSFDLEYPTPAAGAKPGAAPTPATAARAAPQDLSRLTGSSAIVAAAARYAQGRSYNGHPYIPHAVMQEGHIEYRNGIPGEYVKYVTAGAGGSTEWTPLR